MTLTNNVHLTRIINAPRAKVFTAWKNPDALKHWIAPGALQVPSIKMDFRVGGAFSIDMEGEMRGKHSKGILSGVYKEIVPNERLVFACTGTWRGQAPETTVTVTFKDVVGGTEITLTQTGFVDQRDFEGHDHGWKSSFDKLNNLF